MNNVEVNLNGNNNSPNSNSNINYQELNNDNFNKEHDNSNEGINNLNEEIEEEPEQEELTIAEIEHLKKIQEQTLLRAEKYANLYTTSPPDNNSAIPKELDSDEKINNYNSSPETNYSHNVLEIYNENDNEHFNEEKINPNKERIFSKIHCYIYFDSEPLVIIGPHLAYFIWIFTFVSFFSIFIYSLKTSSFIGNIIYITCYTFFAICYILLMIGNPGIPTEKKFHDINDLNTNYRQCKKCNCIYKKKKIVNHCEQCGICVEGSEKHSNWATKCIGRKNKKIYKAWIVSIFVFVLAMIYYLIF